MLVFALFGYSRNPPPALPELPSSPVPKPIPAVGVELLGEARAVGGDAAEQPARRIVLVIDLNRPGFGGGSNL